MLYKVTFRKGGSFSTFNQRREFGQLIRKGATFQGLDEAREMQISSPVDVSQILRGSTVILSFELLAETAKEEEPIYIS